MSSEVDLSEDFLESIELSCTAFQSDLDNESYADDVRSYIEAFGMCNFESFTSQATPKKVLAMINEIKRLRSIDKKEEISLEKLFREFEVVVNREATEDTLKRLWRLYVHERLEEAFAQYVPWEFVNELMEIYWTTKVMRDMYIKYVYHFEKKREKK